MARIHRPRTNDERRRLGLFTGIAGVVALVLVALPLWTSPAQAAPTTVWGPQVGVTGNSIGFQITGCQASAGVPDIAITINTDLNGHRDDQGFELAQNNLYAYSAPAEWSFGEGNASAGPTYRVYVTCVETGASAATTTDVGSFTYLRATTTTAAGATTTTSGATTTSVAGATTTTVAGATTTTVAPSTTIPGATTTTAPGATTTTVAGATTTTVAGATTTTVAGATTTTAPGATTTTVAGATTSTTAGVIVSDATPFKGTAVVVSAGGFAPNGAVAVDLLSTPVRLTTLIANAQGIASGSVTIPLDTVAGSHEIRFSGIRADGSTLVRSVQITVSEGLPKTGVNTWSTLRLALLMLGIGCLAAGRGQLIAAKR